MNTKIEWAEKVWNPVTGCSPVSDGCKNCYARRMAQRLRGRFGYPADDPFKVNWRGDYIAPSKGYPVIHEPLHWKKPCRIFVCSMGDLFHEAVSGPKINEIWYRMFNTSRHIYQVLTKRPERMKWWTECAARNKHWPINEIWPPHVWLGVSVENQRAADERIPILLQIPAAVRFVSVEPMLKRINLNNISHPLKHPKCKIDLKLNIWNNIHWVICGGESGPKRRPFDLDWARDLRDQCKAVGVPFFMKQVDKKIPIPDDLMIREYPNRI